jgi:hypothetical protein
MPLENGTGRLLLADRQALLALTPPPACRIAPVEAEFVYGPSPSGAAVTGLTVSGLAWGADALRVTVEHPLLAAPELNPAVGADKSWSAFFDFAASPLPFGASVKLKARSLSGACDAVVEATLALGPRPGEGAALLPGAGCSSGFDAARGRFVGGFADRFFHSRHYVPMACSYWEWTGVDRKKVTDMMARAGYDGESIRSALNAVQGQVRQLGRSLESQGAATASGVLSGSDILEVFQKAFGSLARKLQGGKADKKETEVFGAVAGPAGWTLGQPRPLSPKEALEDFLPAPGVQGVTLNARGLAIATRSGIFHHINVGWLGVLYDDRLRFRPAGLFPGEQVYSLALAPGEEATLSQRSETKRSSSFEDVRDREMEKQLEFQSVWSTEFSQQDMAKMGNEFGGDMGVPVEAGMKAGVNAKGTYEVSATDQRKRTLQLTEKFTTRAKQQHKITFRQQADATDESTVKRVVKNFNPSRAMTLHYHKLYQKYRVTLERHDARLCYSACLEDPSAALRAELVREIDLYAHPLDPAATACPSPQEKAHKEEPVKLDQVQRPGSGERHHVYAEFTLTLPPGHVLTACDLPKVNGWSWRYTSGGNQGDHLSTDQTFFDQGGEVQGWFTDAGPMVGDGGPQRLKARVVVPQNYSATDRPWETTAVWVELHWKSAPSAAYAKDIADCQAREAQAVRESFSAERVMALVERLKGRKDELIFKALLETEFLPGSADLGVDAPCPLLEKIRGWFDWDDLSVEYLPWWMTASGQRHHDELLAAVATLPAEVKDRIAVDDLFMASYARVYLPIRTDLEWEVVSQFADVAEEDRPWLKRCVDEFVSWRAQNLGPVSHSLPDYKEVTAIDSGLATPSDRPQWDRAWEEPRRKFLVLDEWADSLPTDGVHAEPRLSACGGADEFRAGALAADISAAGEKA